jgi:CRP-like cAMP-binding protein
MDGERHLADLSAGDFFGEMALLDEERRSASVRATSPMRLMVMTRQEFHSMIAAVPSIDERIRAKVAERLDNSAR